MRSEKRKEFVRGMSSGVPIMLGYLSVSFGFGIKAVSCGLTAFEASLISLTNVTSAGQAAGVELIAAGGSMLELILVQIVINIRYSLMGLSLSQKLDRRFTMKHRLAASYGITDEIFALCAAQKEPLRPQFIYGMITVSVAGWVTGTALGAAAGMLLPASLAGALGIMLYGMFLAIIIPPARRERSILCVVIAAALLSLFFKYLVPAVSEGFAIIICSVAAAALGAAIFPVRGDSGQEEQSGEPEGKESEV